MPDAPVRVMIVDDSPTARMALRHALEKEPGLKVVSEVEGGEHALKVLPLLSPDIVLLDVFLRGHSGLDVAATIMRRFPRPILIVTAANPKDPSIAFRAIQAGALDVCGKLPAPTNPEYEAARTRLTRLVRVLAQVPVVTRGAARPPASAVAPSARSTASHPLVVIGASTGGPPIVRELLAALPGPFPAPIAIVQHITPGFGEGFARWLEAETGHPVSIVDRQMVLEPGRVYCSRDDRHLAVISSTSVAPSDADEEQFQKPAVDVLFRTAATFFGSRAVGVLLTGMGADGAEGLRLLREAGAFTVAQAPESCAVDGMPAAAIARRAAIEVLTPERIPAATIAAVTAALR